MVKSFKIKIIVPTVTIFFVLVASLIFYSSIKFSDYGRVHIDDKVNTNIKSLKLYLDDCKLRTRTAAVSMALNTKAVKAIKEQDRNAIYNIFSSFIDLYEIGYFTITDNKGNVLARTYDSELYNDSLLDQQSILDAIEGKVSTYYGSGTAVKVSIRTGAPVYDENNKLIGIVSAGVRFDSNDTLDKLKQLLHADVTVYYGNTRISTTIINDSERVVGTMMNPVVAEAVIINKQEFSKELTIVDNKYKTFYMPLFNSKNEYFATFSLGTRLTEFEAQATSLIVDGVIIGAIGLVTSIMLLSVIISSIVSSINDTFMIFPKDKTHNTGGNSNERKVVNSNLSPGSGNTK